MARNNGNHDLSSRGGVDKSLQDGVRAAHIGSFSALEILMSSTGNNVLREAEKINTLHDRLSNLARAALAAPAENGTGTVVRAGPEKNPLDELTKREKEVLAMAAEGHSNGKIAKLLWVEEQTIKFHLSNIYRKLDVSNRTEAAKLHLLHAQGLAVQREGAKESAELVSPTMPSAARAEAGPGQEIDDIRLAAAHFIAAEQLLTRVQEDRAEGTIFSRLQEQMTVDQKR